MKKLASNLFYMTTFEKDALQKPGNYGLGLELVEYMMTYTDAEIQERHEYVPKLMEGFKNFSFHGTIISRDIIKINKLSDDELTAIYNESCKYARFHGVDKIVFHANYSAEFETASSWLSRRTLFWKRFLQDKPVSFRLYLENLVDETPEMMAKLCDSVDDPRFKLCLDTGHVCCNSSVGIHEWIETLGRRVEHVHLHNNDGVLDKHWDLGQGVLDMAEVVDGLLKFANVQAFVLECNFNKSWNWLQANNFLLTEE